MSNDSDTNELERLTEEVRRAKHSCLALFVSLRVSAEELRHIQEMVEEGARLVNVLRNSEIVDASAFRSLKELRDG
jgi:hypothetical protein